MPLKSIAPLAPVLREILVEAGTIAMRNFRQPLDVAVKRDGSPATIADREVNDFLHKALGELLPSAGWLSEESADSPQRLESDWVWIVDPIDGTKEYVRGTPEFAVSVALVHQHQAVMGGVSNPATNEGAVGLVGGDTISWGITRSQPSVSELGKARATVSRSEVEGGSIAPYSGFVGTTTPIGSVAYKLLRVACGMDDMTFSAQPKNEWDICGGVGLLESVGKVYRRFDGRPTRFNQKSTLVPCGAVAADAVLAERFLEASAALVISTDGENH